MKGIWETHVTPINIVVLLFTWVNAADSTSLQLGGHHLMKTTCFFIPVFFHVPVGLK
jgi:hypothetical protein